MTLEFVSVNPSIDEVSPVVNRISPESRVSKDFLRQSIPIWEKKKDEPREDYTNLLTGALAEAGIAYKSLTEKGSVSTETKRYIEANERTKAFEAATDKLIMRTFQYWDNEKKCLIGFGVPTISIYENGLKAIQNKMEKEGGKFDFEKRRRQIELADAQVTNDAIDWGLLDKYTKVTISSFPQEADPDTARLVGYFPERKIAMVRVQDFNPENGILTTTQIMIDNSDAAIFARLAAKLVGEDEDKVGNFDSSRVLGLQLLVPKEAGVEVTDIAKMYDRVLKETNGREFFFGQETSENNNNSYEMIAEKTRTIEERTEPLIKKLVETDIQLAHSLYQGKTNEKVEEKIMNLIGLQDENRFFLSEHNRNVLRKALSGDFSPEAARIIKEFETKDVYLSILCVANPDQAEKLLGKKQTQKVQRAYVSRPEEFVNKYQVFNPRSDTILYFCGGIINFTSPGRGSMGFNLLGTGGFYALGQNEFVNLLIEGSFFSCPSCDKPIASGKGITKCPHCGITKEEYGSRCD